MLFKFLIFFIFFYAYKYLYIFLNENLKCIIEISNYLNQLRAKSKRSKAKFITMRYTIGTLILCPNLLGIYTKYVFKILREKKSLIHLKDSKMLDCHLRSIAQNARSSSTKRISLKHEARNKRQISDMLHPYHKPDGCNYPFN